MLIFLACVKMLSFEVLIIFENVMVEWFIWSHSICITIFQKVKCHILFIKEMGADDQKFRTQSHQ
jgi:hypothetical protein